MLVIEPDSSSKLGECLACRTCDNLASCLTLSSMDKAVMALRALVGGEDNPAMRQQVADAIDANEQYLYQIVKGIPLKSGKPRSVGRALREKLDKHFPGWESLADAGAGLPAQATSVEPTLADALPVVLKALAACRQPAKLKIAINALIDDPTGGYERQVAEALGAVKPHTKETLRQLVG